MKIVTPQAQLIKFALGSLAIVLAVITLNMYWHQLTDWLPWSSASQLATAQRSAAVAAAEDTTSKIRLGEQGAIYDRESHTIRMQPKIIQETESAAAAAEAATNDLDATNAFFDGVCKRLQYPGDPECISKDNTTNR